MYIKLILSLLILTLILCFTNKNFAAQTNELQNLEIQKIKTLEFDINDENFEGLFFGQITGVAVDENGNIYISDTMQQTIFKLDSNGDFIQKIGRRVRGPGEFLELGKIFIFDNELLAFDPMQFKVEVFDLEGKVIETIPTPRGSQVLNFIKHLYEYDEEHFLAYYKISGFGRYEQYDQDEIFHIWKKDFSEEVENFGSFDDIGFDSGYERRFSDFWGSSLIYDKNRITYAPYVYKGEIHLFKRDNDSWILQSKIETTPPSIVPSESKVSETEEYGRITGMGGQFYGRINVFDGGLFKENDGSIVHFYFERTEESLDDNWRLHVQKFNSDMQLLGSSKIIDFQEGEIRSTSGAIYYKDIHNNYYLIRGEKGAEKIDVFKVVMD